ncbi:MAG: hypothetical protein LQ346_006020 [Caloplaca aetnensis]|nr:MAG: hypothetical protein LQ346_006020 [Caloplaca aetnensis]
MAALGWKRLNDTPDYELYPPSIYANDDDGRVSPPGDHHELIHGQDVSSVGSSRRKPSRPSLGKPTKKRTFHLLHLSTVAISLICLVLAITAVADESASWRLGVNNRQLIVLGFLLSIMNICLGSVAPTLYLLLEARFGSSTLQNYNGILRNQFFSPKLSFVWRLVIGLATALPLGLSVAYKTFTGGSSAQTVDVAALIGNASYYGMFAPPGLQLLGEKTGVSIFSNATLPYAVASAPPNGSELPLPTAAQTYGYNVILLHNESAAVLDIPQPSYISAVQTLLAGGESWNISAPVFATVATFNHSSTRDPDAYASYFDDVCSAAEESSGAYTHMSMMNDWSVVLLNHPSPGDQSLQYIGLTPDPGIEHMPSCSDFFPYAKAYDVTRQACQGTWTITRGGIELVEGSCDGTMLPVDRQEVILHNSLFLGVWYMSSLVEFLGPFATARNESEWSGPSMAIGVAAMVWSKITVLNSPISQDESFRASKELARLTAEEAGLVYAVNDTAKYIRPTLRKSGLLYLLLAIQPALVIIILGWMAVLRSTPLDRGFGLVSILSGVDRDSLDSLAGAGLSGELSRSVKLVIRPTYEDAKGLVKYYVAPASSTAAVQNEGLTPRMIYH